MATIDDFLKIEIKVGTVLEAEEVEGSDKLLKLKVDFGEEKPRQVLSGIKKWYSPSELKDGQFLFVTNLEPRKIMGMDSEAMIMGIDDEKDDDLFLAVPNAAAVSGSKVR